MHGPLPARRGGFLCSVPSGSPGTRGCLCVGLVWIWCEGSSGGFPGQVQERIRPTATGFDFISHKNAARAFVLFLFAHFFKVFVCVGVGSGVTVASCGMLVVV